MSCTETGCGPERQQKETGEQGAEGTGQKNAEENPKGRREGRKKQCTRHGLLVRESMTSRSGEERSEDLPAFAEGKGYLISLPDIRSRHPIDCDADSGALLCILAQREPERRTQKKTQKADGRKSAAIPCVFVSTGGRMAL